MNKPSTSWRSCRKASVSKSMQVTSEAMISTNSGILTTGTSVRRTSEITEFVTTSTEVVATPSANPLTAVVVIASSGQRPSSWTRAGLLVHKPDRSVCLSSFILVVERSLFLVGREARRGGEKLLSMALEVYQCVVHGSDDGTRRNGRAGQPVECTAVFLDGPEPRRRVAEPLAVELQYPA